MNIIKELKLQYKIGDMTTKLIFWNVLLYAVPEIIFAILKLFLITISYQEYVGLSNIVEDLIYKPWSVISYSFFHASFFHIFFNMVMLNFVGKLFTTFFTQKQLLGLYILGGLFGGFIYMVSYAFFPLLANQHALLVGASASVMAILLATTVYQPDMPVRLMFLGTVKLWHIAIVFIILDLIQLPMENTGGHLAHLGGAMMGFLYIKQLQNGRDLASGINNILDWFANIFSGKKNNTFKKVYRNPRPNPQTKPVSRIIAKDKNQQQVDDILDKISESGYESLTKEEKEFLFKAGK
jgi:membrane associated rhomboid family serine protease